MKSALALLASVLLACGCSTSNNGSAVHWPPLDSGQAEQVALHADDSKRDALAAADAAGLTVVFRGRALQMLQAEARAMRRRGLRLEERDSVRTLVFWDASAKEVVLEVKAEDRLLTPNQADPAWTAVVRQSWSHLDYVDGAWWIVDQVELTPDRWRPVPRRV